MIVAILLDHFCLSCVRRLTGISVHRCVELAGTNVQILQPMHVEMIIEYVLQFSNNAFWSCLCNVQLCYIIEKIIDIID